MSTETTNTTSVKEVEMDLGDLNSFLAIPGAESVLIPSDPKDTVFTQKTVDTKFLDNPPEDDEKDKVDETGKIIPLTAAASTTTLDSIVNTTKKILI